MELDIEPHQGTETQISAGNPADAVSYQVMEVISINIYPKLEFY